MRHAAIKMVSLNCTVSLQRIVFINVQYCRKYLAYEHSKLQMANFPAVRKLINPPDLQHHACYIRNIVVSHIS